jgi:mono/diheme cytochrome c family protein
MKSVGTIAQSRLGRASLIGASSLGGLAVLMAGTICVSAVPTGSRAAAEPARDNAPAPDGKQLYAVHCAQCHGETGDGEGPAARFLFPRPRNFTDAKFRLANTANLMPTDDDLFAIITRGMPGSAMFPFGHLSEAERRALVGHVRELTRTGLFRTGKQAAEAAGEKVDVAELQKQVDEVLKPGEKFAMPAEWPADDQASIARGNELYQKTCASCHGATGKGDGVQDQRDSTGMPTSPRDFSRGIFKGGRDREQLYARILLGMAGTPMPANNLQPSEIADLVNLVQSFAPAAAQAQVEHRRQRVVARRVPGSLAGDIPDAAWTAAAATRIVVSPLWWRNYAEPALTIAAIHDGQSVAIRLSWRDPTRDDVIRKPEDFEDMAAVQLFQGSPEPFLGMGSAAAMPDLWLWRATWSRPKDDTDRQLDDYPFDTPFYRERLKAAGKSVPELATARAAGNPHAHADAAQTAANLAAKGFGSTTFRPKAAQNVTAKSEWKDGRWTVVFRRPLTVPAEAGSTLAPGGRSSVSFAIWDGAARDRNGQKLISIWHDLELEK